MLKSNIFYYFKIWIYFDINVDTDLVFADSLTLYVL